MAFAECSKCGVGSISATSTSRVISNVACAKALFLSECALRMTKVADTSTGEMMTSAVASLLITKDHCVNYATESPSGFTAGSDPETLKWFVQAELVHCRWAMLGAAGIFIPEALTKMGILNTPSWTVAGDADYFTDKTTLFVIELILFAWAEGRRWADIVNPGCVNVDPVFPNNKLTGTDVGYPGGLWFDPLGWGQTSDAAKRKDLRTREIKNGRLAMLAVLGAIVQANYTHTGPIDNLVAHLVDPGHNTIFALSNLVGK